MKRENNAFKDAVIRQDTRHNTQDTRHKTQDTRHKTWEKRKGRFVWGCVSFITRFCTDRMMRAHPIIFFSPAKWRCLIFMTVAFLRICRSIREHASIQETCARTGTSWTVRECIPCLKLCSRLPWNPAANAWQWLKRFGCGCCSANGSAFTQNAGSVCRICLNRMDYWRENVAGNYNYQINQITWSLPNLFCKRTTRKTRTNTKTMM